MSTRSVVAYRTEEGWRGRYIHFDGYPDYMNGALSEIVKRDGYEKAKAVLCDEHRSWSQVDPNVQTKATEMLGDRGEYVDGYGVAYTDEPDDYWYSSDNPEALYPWIEYIHILEANGTVTSSEVTA